MKSETIAPHDQTDHETGLEIIRVLNLRRKRDNGRIETTHGDKSPCGLARTVRGLDPGHAAMLAALQTLAPRAQDAKRFSKADWLLICKAIRKATA